MSEDERDDIIVLVGDDGEEIEFEHLDTIEMDENEYVILLPLENQEDEEVDEVVILKVDHNEDGEDAFVTVDDEDELDELLVAACEVADPATKDGPLKAGLGAVYTLDNDDAISSPKNKRLDAVFHTK